VENYRLTFSVIAWYAASYGGYPVRRQSHDPQSFGVQVFVDGLGHVEIFNFPLFGNIKIYDYRPLYLMHYSAVGILKGLIEKSQELRDAAGVFGLPLKFFH